MPGMSGYGEEKLVKYKLVRFIDQTVEKGRQYRYRVKVLVEDPNYPESYDAPSLAGLDPVAQARVRALQAKDAKSGKRKTTYLPSEYSTVSDVVTLPPAEWFYAGKVEPESYQQLDSANNKRYPTFKTQAATALVVVQDEKKAVDVPAKWEVYKGSAINFTLPAPGDIAPREIEVIHPALGEKRKIEKYSFQTNAVVADMRGGDDIPLVTVRTTALKAPGEILFVDSAGNMHVRDEVDDIEYFHRFIGPEEKEAKKKKPDEGAGAADFGGMMMGIPGGPGGMPASGGIPGGTPGSKSKPKR